ncbi:MAG: ATP-binding protein [Clostridia bacterium]|nr:ATP-binding protein [Clostridia bacterium]MEE1125742.1 ATP-binding protein [Acutalibacteraceae bacterium]
MGYDKKVYAEANDIIRDRRNKALKNADIAKERFFVKYPQAEMLEKELSSTLTKITRLMLRGGIELKDALEELKKENLATQEKLRVIYKQAGITEADLEPEFHCSLCEDNGNVDGKMCICYKQLIKEIACNNLNKLSPFKLSTFDTFQLKYYSDTIQEGSALSDRERMAKYFEFCKNYVQTFDESSRNILMKGNTGLGKTHLSLAIGRAVIEKGFGVIYCSTPEILSKLEKEHFRKTNNDEDSEETLKECDLLILDDLGSEFHTSFTKNKIYNIINFRLIHQKPTIISTNLDFDELESSYSKRLISRLMGEYVIMNFVGTDIRQAKRLEKYK